MISLNAKFAQGGDEIYTCFLTDTNVAVTLAPNLYKKSKDRKVKEVFTTFSEEEVKN